MTQLTELEQQIAQTKATLRQLEDRADEISKQLRAQVVATKRGNTVTLRYNGCEVKARRNRHWRWDISIKGEVILRDYHLGINDLKLALARGQI